MSKRMNRREFLETGGKAALGVGLGMFAANALATPSHSQEQRVSANDKILIGVIGTGGMGMLNMHGFMGNPNVEITSVCDVDSNHLNRALAEVEEKYGRKPKAVKDFREILDMKEVDAVIINTPDHWHALPCIMAFEAGKDVFLEKPNSHSIVEGQSMVAAAKHFDRVVQVNTWQRSVGFYRQAINFVRSGGLGKVNICRAWLCGPAGLGQNPKEDPPAHLDWDFWCGPAPMNPYQRTYHPGMWRLYFDYGTGMSGDWGIHLIDIALLAMDDWHPLEVSAVGGKFASGENDDRDTPDTMMTIYRFSDWVMNWEIKVGGEGLDGGGGHGTLFIGEKGKLIIDRGGINWTPYGDHPGPESAGEDQGGDHPGRWADENHMGEFLNNMRTRKKCASDIETMHYTTTACHLSNLSYQAGRSIKWDGEKGAVIGDPKAMEYPAYQREYRKPWSLPIYKT